MNSNQNKQIEDEDLYALLGIKKDASKNDIKKAYKKLAKVFHPDHHQGEMREDAENRFVKINQAYEILMDDDQRMIYDIYGMQAISSNMCKDLVKRYPTQDEVTTQPTLPSILIGECSAKMSHFVFVLLS